MTSRVARGGLTLAVVAAVCAALVAATYGLTTDRIAANEQAWLERSLLPALGDVRFDGSIADSKLVLEPPHELPGSDAAIIYRAWSGGVPAAALFAVTARDGYAGPIRLLVGIRADGSITGVYQFGGRSLGDPPLAAWRLRADGGEFDQLTGASVTPRAVVRAIRETLLYFDAHEAEIFDMPATADSQ
jgi:electron transport complex protein RnfG